MGDLPSRAASVPHSGSKAENEARAQAGVAVNGQTRRRKGRNKPFLYRLTEARRAQLERLADALSVGRSDENRATFTETLDAALDALEHQRRDRKL